MRPFPPLRLSAGDLTLSPAASIIIFIIIGRLDWDLHGQKVVCSHGFVFTFISRHRHRRCFRFRINWNLARSSSPCLTGLSLDLTNYGNSFARVRTRERGGESEAQENSGFGGWWGGRGTVSRTAAMNNGLPQSRAGEDKLTSCLCGLKQVAWHPIYQHMYRLLEESNVRAPLLWQLSLQMGRGLRSVDLGPLACAHRLLHVPEATVALA